MTIFGQYPNDIVKFGISDVCLEGSYMGQFRQISKKSWLTIKKFFKMNENIYLSNKKIERLQK